MTTGERAPAAARIMVPMAPMLRDEWYVAAFSEELATGPLGRQICGERVALYRRGDGGVTALEDRCSHRRYPLSRGRVQGNELQCGYHGARFDAAGKCVAIPGQAAIPAGFHLRAYPVHEKDGVVFIWMGDAAPADPATLPDWRINAAPDWAQVRGLHHMPANYQLVLDNLLDLTHVEFVHKNLGGPGIAENPLEFSVDGDRVHTFRMMRNVDLPGLFKAMGKSGKFDRWQKQHVAAPSYVYFEAGAEPAGSNDPPAAPHHVVIQGVTPESATSTHYFWMAARHFAIDDDALSDTMRAITIDAFDEDVAVLAAQQGAIDADGDRRERPFNAFQCDAAGIAVRRILARRLDSVA
ncbi:MAG: Rieske 2Fe-2S domain-containing protein [Stellaceae bacterium]